MHQPTPGRLQSVRQAQQVIISGKRVYLGITMERNTILELKAAVWVSRSDEHGRLGNTSQRLLGLVPTYVLALQHDV